MEKNSKANSNIPAMIELARIEGELLTIKSRVKLDLDMPDEDNFKQYHYDIMHLAEDYGYRLGKGDFESPKCNELVSSINSLAKELETTDVGNLWGLSQQTGFDNGEEIRESQRVIPIYLVHSRSGDYTHGDTLFDDFDKACELYKSKLKFIAFDEVHQGHTNGISASIYSKDVLLSEYEKEVDNLFEKLHSRQGKILDDSFMDITSTIHLVDGGLSPDNETLTYGYWLDYAKNEKNLSIVDAFQEGNHDSYHDDEVDIYVVRYEHSDGNNHGAYFKELDVAKDFFNSCKAQEQARSANDEQFLDYDVSLFTRKVLETSLGYIDFRHIHQFFDESFFENITDSTEGLHLSSHEIVDIMEEYEARRAQQYQFKDRVTNIDPIHFGELDSKTFENWKNNPGSKDLLQEFANLQNEISDYNRQPEKKHLKGEHLEQHIIDMNSTMEELRGKILENYNKFQSSKIDNVSIGFAMLKELSGSLQSNEKEETNQQKDLVLWSPGKPWAEDNLVYKHSIGEYVSDSSGRTLPEILDDQPELIPLDKEKFLQWYQDRGAAEYQKPGIILTPQQSEMIKSDVESFCLPESESQKSPNISNQNRANRMS